MLGDEALFMFVYEKIQNIYTGKLRRITVVQLQKKLMQVQKCAVGPHESLEIDTVVV